MDDILDMLDSVETESEKKPYKKKKNLWDEVITPKELDVDSMERNTKEYTVISHGDISKDKLELLNKIIKILDSKDYKLRASCDKNDVAVKLATRVAEHKEFYIPWKNFNKGCLDFSKDKYYIPSEDAYGIACKIKKNFNDQSAVIRAILARNASMVFGNNGNKPIDFILVYTPDGKEVGGKDAYKTMGNVAAFIYLAKLGNIPVFNINASDFLTRFNDFLKSKS